MKKIVKISINFRNLWNASRKPKVISSQALAAKMFIRKTIIGRIQKHPAVGLLPKNGCVNVYSRRDIGYYNTPRNRSWFSLAYDSVWNHRQGNELRATVRFTFLNQSTPTIQTLGSTTTHEILEKQQITSLLVRRQLILANSETDFCHQFLSLTKTVYGNL